MHLHKPFLVIIESIFPQIDNHWLTVLFKISQTHLFTVYEVQNKDNLITFNIPSNDKNYEV